MASVTIRPVYNTKWSLFIHSPAARAHSADSPSSSLPFYALVLAISIPPPPSARYSQRAHTARIICDSSFPGRSIIEQHRAVDSRTTGQAATHFEETSVKDDFSTIEAAVAAIGRGEIVIVVDAEDRENEGRLHLRRRKGHAGNRELHDHARARPALHARAARSLRAAQAAADGRVEHRARWARPSRCRSIIAPADRHHGPRTGTHDPRNRRSDQQTERFRAARAPVSAGRQGRGRAAPRRAYRGRGRSGPHGRLVAGGRACAKSSTSKATGQPAPDCSIWRGSTVWRSSRSRS